MDQDQSGLTFDESVQQVMQTLPPPIRNYLVGGTYSAVAGNLVTKYGLHVDQGGVLEREIMLLLMGIESPDEFMQALVTEANLDQQTIDGIMRDVNTQIFVPLREQMRSGTGNTPQPAKPAAASVGVPSYAPRPVEARQPMGVMTPPPQSPKYFHLENKLPPSGFVQRPPPTSTIAPLPPKTVLPSPAVSGKVQGASAETPLGQVLRAVVPPANLPGAMPGIATTNNQQPTSDIIPATPKAPPAPYSVDPYRESIDEK